MLLGPPPFYTEITIWFSVSSSLISLSSWMGLIILILLNWLFFKGSEQVEQAELEEAGDNVSSGDKIGTLWIISDLA